MGESSVPRPSGDRPASPPSASRRCSVRVTGVVQGVGYRPFVHRLAKSLHLFGHVGNDAAGVFIEVQGPSPDVARFLAQLASDAPALARVENVSVCAELPADGALSGFRIAASPSGAAGAGTTSLPPDTATCRECLAELFDPANRRFGYPFTACTNCGPRFTITRGLPYDRANTTMSDFPLCPTCRAEYEDPASRRFHAQPTACWDCGPRLSMPVTQLARLLAAGAIVAVKGVGGYHLACAGRDQQAVARLRERKARGAKPFAVMAADLAAVRRIAHMTPADEQLLSSAARPIVLLDSRDRQLQASIAPGIDFIGVMLPHSGLHHLLFAALAALPASARTDLLVMTSGNLSDEPICTTREEAVQRLSGIAAAFCHHDRHISVACDDSVVRRVGAAVQPVRRSRGYAPLPLPLPMDSPGLLAVGAEIKATACLALGRRAWLSQHIGDTESLPTLAMLARTIDLLCRVQQVAPKAVISDAHPGYRSRRWAAQLAQASGVTHLVVQHHHAHLAALLAEHGVAPGTQVLGCTFDGTGFGQDCTIWGGELLLGSYDQVRRIGHLRPILLPGGDAAIRHPARTAIAHAVAAGLSVDPRDPPGRAVGDGLPLLLRMLASGSHCTPTTSAGRLFDAVASLLDVRHDMDYEGQAAIELEALARGGTDVGDDEGWPAEVTQAGESIIIDPTSWIERAAAAQREGLPVAQAARDFHIGLARAVQAAAELARQRYGVQTVGLTGGVFANALLSEQCTQRLVRSGFGVLVHRLVPPNDGGLALGQVAVAAAGGARRLSGPELNLHGTTNSGARPAAPGLVGRG